MQYFIPDNQGMTADPLVAPFQPMQGQLQPFSQNPVLGPGVSVNCPKGQYETVANRKSSPLQNPPQNLAIGPGRLVVATPKKPHDSNKSLVIAT